MADSLPPVEVKGLWVDVYEATGIAVGQSLLIQVKSGDVELSIGATEPTNDEAFGMFDPRSWIQIDGGETGLWARAKGGTAYLYVQDDNSG